MSNKIVSYLILCMLSPFVGALEIQGEWIQGGLLIGKVVPGSTVTFSGKTPTISEQGQFVIGLGRNAPETINLVVTRAGHSQSYSFNVRQREYQEQRIEGVPQQTVTPPKEVTARIRQESQLVREARSISDTRQDFLQGFTSPLDGPITGVYGSRRVYNGTPKNPHYGLDVAAPIGTLVVAPAPGIVRLTHDDMYFSGGTLIIDHGHGVSTTFIHLSEILVEPGEYVATGQGIGKVGSTGRATGPHLDWRVNWFDVRLDPALVLKHFPAKTPK